MIKDLKLAELLAEKYKIIYSLLTIKEGTVNGVIISQDSSLASCARDKDNEDYIPIFDDIISCDIGQLVLKELNLKLESVEKQIKDMVK